MSSQTEATADAQSGEKADEKKEGTETTTATTTVTVTDNKSMKKVRSKKDTIYFICSLACLQCQCQYRGRSWSPEQDQSLLAHDLPLPQSPLTSNNLKNDPSRFESPGINFNAKLIGIDEISSARGDKMCQESIQRLKLAVKSSGQHKQKIIVNVSLEGVRLIDLRSQAVNHTHLVHRISFISRDITDSRAFGYVYGAGEGKHKFYAIKTEKAAEALVLSLRDLFQAVYEMKKKEVEEAKQKHEEIEKAEEAKDAQEPVYQVPKNGAPVENKEDPTYQVPTNNAPVTKSEDNLLNLENELESIEKGIEQINDLEDMFTDIRSPTTTSSSSAPWGDDLASLSTGQTQAPTQPAFSVGGAPFSAAPSTMPQGNNPMFGQPFPAPGPGPRPGFGAQPWGTAPSPQPGMVAGFQGASPNPFGAPSLPPRVGVGLPPPPGGFPPTPFPGPGQLNRPGFPAVPPQNFGAPAPAPANDPFGDPFAVGDSGGGFDDNLLTPDKIEVPSEEPEQPPPGKKDAFGDLVAIGPKDKQIKSPKQMFVELATPPKKSLNELKVEKSPSPKPVSPTGFQASGATDGDQENPASSLDFSTLNQFGDKDPFGSGDPFGSSDPFVNCFPNPTQKQDAPKLELPAQNGTNSSSAPSPNALFGGSIFDDDFNLPVPKEPPPPLPTSIDSVSHASLNIPPPPPRNNISVYTPSNTQHTPPLPPRPRSSSDKSRAADVLHVQPTPPLPPRRYLNSQESNSSVPNDELSRESPKESSSVNSQDAELNEQSQTISNNNNVSETKCNSSNNDNNNVSEAKGFSNNDNNVSEAKDKLSLASDTSLSLLNENATEDRAKSSRNERDLADDDHKPFEKGEAELNNRNTSELKQDNNESVSQSKLDKTKCDSPLTLNVSDEKLRNLNNNSVSNSSGDQTNCDIERISNASSSSSQTETVTERVRTGRAFIKEADSNYNKSLSVSVSDPFETIDPFASDDPFTQNDPFSPGPFASDPFSDSISTTSVSSTTSSNDPFTSAITSQKSSSSTNVDASDDPFSVFDNTFEPFHFDKSKKSKVKLKF